VQDCTARADCLALRIRHPQADQIGTAFQAVRKDVRMSVDVRGTSEQNAQTVVSQAMQRVQWPH
jgi:hypothetical protein